jgi:hypothetical protein
MPVFIWAYCIVWWIVQDYCKVMTYRWLEHYNIFGINDTGLVESLVVDHHGMAAKDDNDFEKNETSRLLG